MDYSSRGNQEDVMPGAMKLIDNLNASRSTLEALNNAEQLIQEAEKKIIRTKLPLDVSFKRCEDLNESDRYIQDIIDRKFEEINLKKNINAKKYVILKNNNRPKYNLNKKFRVNHHLEHNTKLNRNDNFVGLNEKTLRKVDLNCRRINRINDTVVNSKIKVKKKYLDLDYLNEKNEMKEDKPIGVDRIDTIKFIKSNGIGNLDEKAEEKINENEDVKLKKTFFDFFIQMPKLNDEKQMKINENDDVDDDKISLIEDEMEMLRVNELLESLNIHQVNLKPPNINYFDKIIKNIDLKINRMSEKTEDLNSSIIKIQQGVKIVNENRINVKFTIPKCDRLKIIKKTLDKSTITSRTDSITNSSKSKVKLDNFSLHSESIEPTKSSTPLSVDKPIEFQINVESIHSDNNENKKASTSHESIAKSIQSRKLASQKSIKSSVKNEEVKNNLDESISNASSATHHDGTSFDVSGIYSEAFEESIIHVETVANQLTDVKNRVECEENTPAKTDPSNDNSSIKSKQLKQLSVGTNPLNSNGELSEGEVYLPSLNSCSYSVGEIRIPKSSSSGGGNHHHHHHHLTS